MNSIVGINLAKNYLQAVLVDNHGMIKQKFRLNFKQAIFSPGNFSGLTILSKELAKLPLEMKKVKQQAIVLPSSLFYSQFLLLKAVERDKINQYLEENAETLFPFSLEEIYYDWKLISQTEKVSEIAVAAVNKEMVDRIVNAFEDNRLRPLVLIPSSLALLNLFLFINQRRRPKIVVKREAESKERKGLVLLEKGANELILTAVINHSPIFSLSFPFQEGLPATKEHLNSNLERLINFCEQKYQSNLLSVGDGYLKIRQLLSFDKSLVKEIETDWKKKLAISVIEPSRTINNLNGDGESVLAALGAGLYRPLLPREISTINLLPQRLQQLYLFEEKFKREVFHLKISLLALFFLLMIIFGSNLLIRWQIIKTRREFIDFKSGANVDEAFLVLEKRANTLNNNIKKINQLFGAEGFSLDIVKQIEKSLVEGISISGFKYREEELKVQISGMAATREALLQFSHNLETAGLREVNIPLGSLEQEANFPFSLSLSIP